MVNLTASPAAVVKVGGTFNLTCVALVTRRPVPVLNFSLLRNNHTMFNSSSTQTQWSSVIENADQSHTGTYRCRVTGPTGVSRDSQELQVTVEASWLPVAVGLGVALCLLLLFSLLLLCLTARGYCCAERIRVCSKTADQDENKKNQEESAGGLTHTGGMELSNMTQIPGESNAVYEEIEVKEMGGEGTSVDELLYADVVMRKKNPGRAKLQPRGEETVYSQVNLDPGAGTRGEGEVTYTEIKPKKKQHKKNRDQTSASLYAELYPA
ncbi:Fc receptor-like A [Arapaima gigas]